MYYFLFSILTLSVVLLFFEAVYVFSKIKTNMHAYIFFYLLVCLINNAGYLLEMRAKDTGAAMSATQMLYLGKCFIPLTLLLFVIKFCHLKINKFLSGGLIGVHFLMWLFIATNDMHHLFYSSATFVEDGLFPHNVYGHGPLYFAFQAIPFIYTIITFAIVARTVPKMQTVEEKKQLFYLLFAPGLSLMGILLFLSGITMGFDTTNIGIALSSVFMIIAMFKYNLIDTEDMVKDSLVDSLKDGIVVVDAYNRVSYLNETAKTILPGVNIEKIATESSIFSDLDLRAKNGERLTVNDKVYALYYEDIYQGNIYRGKLYIMDDITENVNYSRQIEVERDRADDANAAKSIFLSNMSHEIRTPMNGIVGMTDILLRQNFGEEEKSYLQNIRSSGLALLDIINDLLDFSKIESGRMSIIEDDYEPLPLLNDLKMMFQTRIGDKPIRIIYEIDENLPAKLYGDVVRIRQCLTNIVNNSIKFTDVGYVKVEIKVLRDDFNGLFTNSSETGTIRDGDTIKLKIIVTDTGSGIKEDELPKLFESFGQADVKRNHGKEGTGLGLAITKQLLGLMKGKIEVSSEYGKGSTFTLTIPQKVVDSTPATEAKYSNKTENQMTYIAPEARILLVEDNEINVKVAEGLLAPYQFKIDVADNGLSALKKISENTYDLVLMDHLMPVMDGIEATKRIRGFDGEYFKRVPIIALTANAIAGAKEQFINAGMNDFVGKPISLMEISAVIHKWLPSELIQSIEKGAEDEFEVAGENAIVGFSGVNATGDVTGNLEEKVNGKVEDRVMYGELDRSIGLQYCGTEDLYESVLEDFYKLIDSKAAKIEELKAAGDYRNYTIEVHALKSTARMIGATKLSELAFEMEQAGNAENVDAINEKTPILMDMYRAYKDTLSYFDGGDDSNLEVIDKETLKDELSKMNVAAYDFDMDAIDEIMAKLSGYKMPSDDIKEDFGKLDTLVRDVALEEIKELTSKICSRL
ncbi:MAG: ATP-binding protein [Lachnospiraceae bacterium]|nr:ATP-binding protein [Lachnospiraceae bacterium]